MAVNSRYGKGDLCGISLGKETTYGTAPDAAAMAHAGIMTTYDRDDGIEFDEVIYCGSRTMGTRYISQKDHTVSVSFRMGNTVSLRAWMEWLLGSGTVSGATVINLLQTPSSRTALFKIGPGDYDVARGAYINKLTLKSEEMGKALLLSAEIYAKTVSTNPDGFTNHSKQISTATPVRTSQVWTCTTTSIGSIPSGKWTLVISQNLEKSAGVDSTGGFTLASGDEPTLGAPEVTLEVTIPASSRKWDLLRESATSGLRFSTTVGDAVITLSGCIIEGKGPSRSADPYDETITIRATNILITQPSGGA